MPGLSTPGLVLVVLGALTAIAIGLLMYADDISEWWARRRGCDEQISTSPANNPPHRHQRRGGAR